MENQQSPQSDLTPRQKIERLGRDDPLVRMALDYHDHREVPWVEALEFLVLGLAQTSAQYREKALECARLHSTHSFHVDWACACT